jgi:hypothetical protein
MLVNLEGDRPGLVVPQRSGEELVDDRVQSLPRARDRQFAAKLPARVLGEDLADRPFVADLDGADIASHHGLAVSGCGHFALLGRCSSGR